jgi:hypothetical protein
MSHRAATGHLTRLCFVQLNCPRGRDLFPAKIPIRFKIDAAEASEGGDTRTSAGQQDGERVERQGDCLATGMKPNHAEEVDFPNMLLSVDDDEAEERSHQ